MRTRQALLETRVFTDRNGVSDDLDNYSIDENDEDDRRMHIDPILEEALEDERTEKDYEECTEEDLTWEDHAIEPLPVENSLRSGVRYSPLVPTTDEAYRGAINIPIGTKKAGEFLDLMFTPEMLERFVTATNSFVSNKATPDWTPEHSLTVVELKKYFGLLLYMGVVQRPSKKMHWEKNIFGDSFVPSIIPRRRFLAIHYNLHWYDASEMTDEERRARNAADGFWTIADFFDVLAENFMRHFMSVVAFCRLTK